MWCFRISIALHRDCLCSASPEKGWEKEQNDRKRALRTPLRRIATSFHACFRNTSRKNFVKDNSRLGETGILHDQQTICCLCACECRVSKLRELSRILDVTGHILFPLETFYINLDPLGLRVGFMYDQS